jgi:hypothetical protein
MAVTTAWLPAQRRGYRLSLALTLSRLVLAPALVVLALTDVPGLVLAAGLLAQAETLAITVVLRGWRHDVPGVWNAMRILA